MVRERVDRHGGEHPGETGALGVVRIEARHRRQALPAALRRVFDAIGEVQNPMYIPAPCQRWCALIGDTLTSARVHPGQVVVLHEVLRDELPVRADRVLDAAHEPVFARAGIRRAARAGRRARPPAPAPIGSRQTKTRQPHCVDAGGMEPVIGLVERLHVRHVEHRLLLFRDAGLRREERRPQARPVEVVRPGVVRALEEPLHPPRLGHEPGRRGGGRRCDGPAARRPDCGRRSASVHATSTTTKAPGSRTSSVTQTGTHAVPKMRSCSRAWNSADV